MRKWSTAYYSLLLIPPPCVQRHAFHLLSGNTMLPVLWCLFAAGKLKWWDVPVCHCMFSYQVSICSWQMTAQGQCRCRRPCHCFSFYIFEKRTLVQEGMIMLLPWGSVLCRITLHISDCSAASTGETKRTQPKEAVSNCFSTTLHVNAWWKMSCRQRLQGEERMGSAVNHTHKHTRTHTLYLLDNMFGWTH